MAQSKNIKDINLLLSYYRKPKVLQTKKPSGMKYIFPALLISILAFFLLNYYNKIKTLEEEVNTAQDYISSENNIELNEKSTQLFNDYISNNTMLTEFQSKTSLSENASYISIEKLNSIYSCLNDTMTLKNINYVNSSSSVVLTLNTTNEFEVNACVKKLIQTGIFDAVYYTGYTFMSDTSQYQVNVICIIKKGQ